MPACESVISGCPDCARGWPYGKGDKDKTLDRILLQFLVPGAQDGPAVRRDASGRDLPCPWEGGIAAHALAPANNCLPAPPSAVVKPFPWVSHCCLRSPFL